MNLKEFEQAIDVANEFMLQADEILATDDVAKIKQFASQVVSTRGDLLDTAANLIVEGINDESKVREISSRFNSKPIAKVTEYLKLK